MKDTWILCEQHKEQMQPEWFVVSDNCEICKTLALLVVKQNGYN